MRIVLDTNVFVSGTFFSGPPQQILRAWRNRLVQIVYSPPIFLEYERVLFELSQEVPGFNVRPFLAFLTHYGELVEPSSSPGISCRDPDDVKFINCLLHAKARCLVTGDKDLLCLKIKTAVILTPRQFCDRHL